MGVFLFFSSGIESQGLLGHNGVSNPLAQSGEANQASDPFSGFVGNQRAPHETRGH